MTPFIHFHRSGHSLASYAHRMTNATAIALNLDLDLWCAIQPPSHTHQIHASESTHSSTPDPVLLCGVLSKLGGSGRPTGRGDDGDTPDLARGSGLPPSAPLLLSSMLSVRMELPFKLEPSLAYPRSVPPPASCKLVPGFCSRLIKAPAPTARLVARTYSESHPCNLKPLQARYSSMRHLLPCRCRPAMTTAVAATVCVALAHLAALALAMRTDPFVSHGVGHGAATTAGTEGVDIPCPCTDPALCLRVLNQPSKEVGGGARAERCTQVVMPCRVLQSCCC